jgi:hypothetical protein
MRYCHLRMDGMAESRLPHGKILGAGGDGKLSQIQLVRGVIGSFPTSSRYCLKQVVKAAKGKKPGTGPLTKIELKPANLRELLHTYPVR